MHTSLLPDCSRTQACTRLFCFLPVSSLPAGKSAGAVVGAGVAASPVSAACCASFCFCKHIDRLLSKGWYGIEQHIYKHCTYLGNYVSTDCGACFAIAFADYVNAAHF